MDCFNLESKKKCCVPGCPGSLVMHRFPKDPARLQTWLSQINNSELKQLDPQTLYNNRRVCSLHFDKNSYVLNCGRKLLKKDALPLLQLNILESTSVENDAELALDQTNTPDVQCHTMEVDKDNIQDQIEGIGELIIEPQPEAFPTTSEVTYKTPRKTPRRSGILKEVAVTRQSMLTPKARHLYKKVVKVSNRMAHMSGRIKSFQERLNAAESVSSQFQGIMEKVNKPTYNFIMSQIRTQQQKPKARRFTLDEKVLCLSMLKASGKGYRLLAKIFTLPTKKTLTTLLNKIHLPTGLDTTLMKSLKGQVNKLKTNDKTSIIIFDEMSIDMGLTYNQKDDFIFGFHDLGDNGRKSLLANYVNVFMVKGVYKQWKQPLCYTFSNGPIKTFDLKCLIKKVIEKCQEAGLNIVAIVCDQGSANQAAIRSLIDDTKADFLRRNEENRNFGFFVNEKEIVPLFDGPHLIKGIRNNLLNKELHFFKDGVQRVAKWEHLEQFYMLDVEDEDQLCSNLTDSHIIRGKINKMKVKCCTQVFSRRVGSLMKRILKWKKPEIKLDEKAIDTAEAILFFDELFDSLNSSQRISPPGKPLKAAVKLSSAHLDFWRQSINILQTMRYFCPKKKSYVSVPTLKNFIFTLKGLIYLCPMLLEGKKNKYIMIRPFQQDALENFFGGIRSHGVREISPNAAHFTSSFKALLVTNFMSKHSPGANCEEDHNEGALDNLKSLLTGEIIPGIGSLESVTLPQQPQIVPLHRRSKIAVNVRSYITGFIAKKVLKQITCVLCTNKFLFREHNVDVEFIEARQYKNCNLTLPGTLFNVIVSEALSRLFFLIPRLCAKLELKKILNDILITNMESFKLLNCPNHPHQDELLRKIIIRCCLFWWCRKVNKIVKGKNEKFVHLVKRKSPAANFDPVKLHAYQMHEKLKKKK